MHWLLSNLLVTVICGSVVAATHKSITDQNPFHPDFKRAVGDNKGLKVLVVVVDNRHLPDSIDGSKGFGGLVAVLQHNYCKRHNYDYVRIVNDKTDLARETAARYPNVVKEIFQQNALDSIDNPKHGFDVLHPGYLRARSSSWGKLPALWHTAEELGAQYDYIWFMDSDATPNPMQNDLSLGDALVKWDSKPEETVQWGKQLPSNATFLFMSNFPYRDDLPCAGTIIFKPTQFARDAMREWWDFDLVYKARDDFMEQDALWYIIEAAPRYSYMINENSMVLLKEQQFSSAWRGYSDIWFAHIPSGEEYRSGYFRTM
jgi:hypothetical protein